MFYIKRNTKSAILPLTILSFILFMVVGIYLLINSTSGDSRVDMLDTASRMVSGIFAAVLTAIALVITLASNLYTPGLVTIFVRQPAIIFGVSVIIAFQFFIVLSYLFSSSHPLYEIIIYISYISSFFILASLIPFMYYISNFLRPTYFLPMLSKKFFEAHTDIENIIDFF